MKTISGIFGFIVAVLALAFAISNRQSATISLWPFGVEVQAPLYLLTLGTFLGGVLFGGAVAWFGAMPHRRQARKLTKDLATLQGKVAGLQQTVIPPVTSQPGNDDFLLEAPQPKRRLWGLQR